MGSGSVPVSDFPHRRHAVGAQVTTVVQSSTGTSARVFGVAGLPPVRALGLGLGSSGFGVRVFGGGRLGGVGRVLAGSGFEFGGARAEAFDLSGWPPEIG